ncbi:MAG: hypothetical protein RLZZ399_882 [Verrucomicrobiota bacterium]
MWRRGLLLTSAVLVFAETVSVGVLPPALLVFNSKDAPPPEAAGVSPDMKPFVDFERILFRARAGEPVEAWRESLQPFLKLSAERGKGAALKELALCWEARARMHAWDKILRSAYVRKGRFPNSLEALLKTAPEELRLDPWGGEWVYAPTAPPHSPHLVGQRYQLGPSRYPKLSTIEAVAKSGPVGPSGKISFSSLVGVNSLQVRGGPQGLNGNFQVGESFDGFTVLWLQKEAALLSGPDGFIPLEF